MKQMYDELHHGIETQDNLSPIIFLHGMASSRREWKKCGPVIAKNTGRKAYALDARNHGESPRSKEMNFEVLTQDVVEFMDDHKIEKAVIVGASMGGRTAINFALNHPQRTEALVVIDMTPKNMKSRSKTFVLLVYEAASEILKSFPSYFDLKTARLSFLEILLQVAAEKCYADKFYEHVDVDMIPIKKVGDSFEFESDVDTLLSMLKEEAFVQDLPEKNLVFDKNALFLYGDLPFFNLGKDTSIKKLFPQAVIKNIKNASHYLHVDSPDIFAETVSNFIMHRNLQASKL